jgi:hypothetical protein
MNDKQKTLLIISFILAFVIPIYGLSQSLASGAYGQTRLSGFTVFVLEAALIAGTVFIYRIFKENPNFKKNVAIALLVFITPFIICAMAFAGYLYVINHQSTQDTSFTVDQPIKLSKDVYQVGEDIQYSYITLRIEAVKRLSTNAIEIDIYEYNSNENPNKIQMFNSQYYLEAPDKTRIEPNYDNGQLRGVDVQPDEAKRGRVIFQNDALKESVQFVLKIQPFDDSTIVPVDISKYLNQ